MSIEFTENGFIKDVSVVVTVVTIYIIGGALLIIDYSHADFCECSLGNFLGSKLLLACDLS
jgi:hypothetical protein